MTYPFTSTGLLINISMSTWPVYNFSLSIVLRQNDPIKRRKHWWPPRCRENIGAEYSQLAAIGEIVAFLDFRQNSEGGFSAVNTASDIVPKFAERIEIYILFDAFDVLSLMQIGRVWCPIRLTNLGFLDIYLLPDPNYNLLQIQSHLFKFYDSVKEQVHIISATEMLRES